MRPYLLPLFMATVLLVACGAPFVYIVHGLYVLITR